jgi:hypothetical protein
MTENRSSGLSMGALLALPILCCLGLTLLIGAGLSIAALAWVGGLALGGAALAFAIVLLAVRRRRSAAGGVRRGGCDR